MDTFIWTILFIVIILLCVTIHEFGHFLSALLIKVKVHEFAVGFGPKIYSFKRKNILFSIRALPLGGYVVPASRGITPELYPDDVIPENGFVDDKKWYEKLLFSVAGIIFNVLLALIISLFLFTIAERTVSYGSFLEQSFVGIIKAFGKIFQGDLSQTQSIPKEIASLSGSNWGITIFSLLVSININLAIFNIFPIPPLDGWRVVELTYEKARGRPMPINIRTSFAIAGITLLLGFTILVLIKDYI